MSASRFTPRPAAHTDHRNRSPVARMLSRLPAMALTFYVILCLVLGGASREGAVANAVLQIIGIALILWAMLDRTLPAMPREGRWLCWIGGGFVALILVQLVPLPPSLWAMLPGRTAIANGFDLMGMARPWAAISLSPDRTIISALGLIPPAAILCLMFKQPARGMRYLLPALTGFLILSVLLGVGQVLPQAGQALYPYERTNYGSMVGLFANANHMATLLLVMIPLGTAMVAMRGRVSFQSRDQMRLVVLAGSIGLIAIGIFGTGSDAGKGLAIPVLIASLLLLLPPASTPRRRWAIRVTIGGVVILCLATIILLIRTPIEPEAAGRLSILMRPTIFHNTVQAALANLPFGTGIGTFPLVYPAFENPALVTATFVNHAHDDYLEMFLETGLPGVVLILLFGWWWLARVRQAWQGTGEQALFACAGSIASAAILVHSLVDYPLRTSAVAALFALACGLMVRRPATVPDASAPTRPRSRARHLSVE